MICKNLCFYIVILIWNHALDLFTNYYYLHLLTSNSCASTICIKLVCSLVMLIFLWINKPCLTLECESEKNVCSWMGFFHLGTMAPPWIPWTSLLITYINDFNHTIKIDIHLYVNDSTLCNVLYTLVMLH